MRHRKKEIIIGISIVVLLAAAGFYADDNPTAMDNSLTGAVVYEQASGDSALASGMAFDASIDGYPYYFIFDGHVWHESTDLLSWNAKEEMGTSLYSGLHYLRNKNAKIYYKYEQVTDISEFVGRMG